MILNWHSYFKEIHPSFPILDEQTFLDLHGSGGETLSPALVCELYAISLTLWDRSNVLKCHPRPDL
jgi:hypothetical protein